MPQRNQLIDAAVKTAETFGVRNTGGVGDHPAIEYLALSGWSEFDHPVAGSADSRVNTEYDHGTIPIMRA